LKSENCSTRIARISNTDAGTYGGILGTVQRLGGSCRYRKYRALVGAWLKSAAEPRTECPVVDRAANLEQEIGTSPGPSHLLRLVHSPIDQEVRRVVRTLSALAMTAVSTSSHPMAMIRAQVVLARASRSNDCRRHGAPSAASAMATGATNIRNTSVPKSDTSAATCVPRNDATRISDVLKR
jgi:hypothetical protein